MARIIKSLIVIIGVSAIVTGATKSFFSDTEISQNNTIQTGTVDIDVDGQNPWTNKYSFANLEPGDTKEIIFNIKNVGTNPVRVWQILENVEGLENGISEPEQQWYDENHITGGKNDVDSAMDFEMNANGDMVVNKEAEFSLADVKNYYLNLVKLDYKEGVLQNGHDGILDPGETISVEHNYYFNPNKAGNWAQSDVLNFDIRILAQPVETPEPLKLMSFIDNKPSWQNTRDNVLGILKYESIGDKFDYNFIGKGLGTGDYRILYQADPWGRKFVGLGDVIHSAGGRVETGEKQVSLGYGLPHETDGNYGYGAKIWLITESEFHGGNVGWANTGKWLFDSWPGLINYTQGNKPVEHDDSDDDPSTPSDPPATPTTENLKIDEVLSTKDWTGEARNYSTANVNFSYNTPANDRLSGTVTANGLKPYTTYQIKFIGKPTCDGSGGNDTANEYIGYKGRWTVLNSSCSGSACNRGDSDYVTNKAKANSDSTKECIAGYLVWDFFTTDASGNATKNVLTDCSYHVLRCNGGSCGLVNDSKLKMPSETSVSYPYCEANDVEGELESGRAACNALTLDNGNYDLNMVLTEESFHQSDYGQWTTVLQKDINFTIN